MCLGPPGKWLLQGCEGGRCAARIRATTWWECWKQDTCSCLPWSAVVTPCHVCAFLPSPCPFPLQNECSLLITLKISGVQILVGMMEFSHTGSWQGQLAQLKHSAAGKTLLPMVEPGPLQLSWVHLSQCGSDLCVAQLLLPCIGCYQKLCVHVGEGGTEIRCPPVSSSLFGQPLWWFS